MKTQFHIILLCLAGLAFSIGCEKATLQHEKTLETGLQNRGDCDECPDAGECCCFVKLHPSISTATLTICGSTSGTSTCTRPGHGLCPPFTGISYSIYLDANTPGLPFCALASGPFWIRNDSGNPVRLIITCQNDLTSPEEIIINLDTDQEMYFENNGDCEITPC